MTILWENAGVTKWGCIAPCYGCVVVNDWRSPFEFRDCLCPDDGLPFASGQSALSQFLN
ncbi:MAG: hypothetical protein LH679_24755 [Cyanobacteria bacterium CAN_BIN43]|nr:hypothetical protein [Cyanobacteria bacterium CAN_BIN43]